MPWRKLVTLAAGMTLLGPFSGLAWAAIWPPGFQEYTRSSDPAPFDPGAAAAIWREYGLAEGETAPYTDGRRRFQVTAWRMKDATGAIAAWYWQLPARSQPLKGLRFASAFDSDGKRGVLAALGNYLIQFVGYRPQTAEIKLILGDLPEFSQGPVPTLPNYLPAAANAGTVRYVLGPESMKAFAAPWTGEQWGLSFGVEGLVAGAGSAPGREKLAVLRYPTPHLARVKLGELSAVGGGPAHRSGPLLALGWGQNPASGPSQALAAAVRSVTFQVTVMANEANPFGVMKDMKNMFISIFVLTGGLLIFCVVGGLAMGGYRIWSRKGGIDGRVFQTLGLGA